MVQALKSKDEYSYRVDVARCVQELETGTPLEQIRLSDYPTLTRVSIFDAQEVCNEEYRVEEVQGKLYPVAGQDKVEDTSALTIKALEA